MFVGAEWREAVDNLVGAYDRVKAGDGPIAICITGETGHGKTRVVQELYASLAVRTITSEHSTGMLRLTFSAMPHRRRVILAKAAIVAGLALGSALVANLVAFVVGQGILSSVDASTTLGAPGVARSIVFGALAVTAVTILGVGLGAILRRTAAATTTLAMAIIGTQMFADVLPDGARRLLPGVVLQATVTGERSSDLLAPVPALLTLGGYAALALVVAAVVVSRRDV